MDSPLRKIARAGFLLAVFLVSAALLAYTWWLYTIEKGNRALGKGDTEAAEEIYRVAEAPFRKVPWLASIFRDEFQKLLFNQVGLLYAQGRNDEVMERLGEGARRAPFLSEVGEYHFWAGNVLLRQAIRMKNPETMMKTLKEARAAYRKGLEVQPDDWDLKYNYELIQSVFAQTGSGKEKEEKVKSILEKMRPAKPPTREELPPEKRG